MRINKNPYPPMYLSPPLTQNKTHNAYRYMQVTTVAF